MLLPFTTMKKYILLGLILAFTLSICEAQVRRKPSYDRRPAYRNNKRVIDIDDMPKNIIKVNYLSPFAATGSFFYERVINEKMSAQLGFSYSKFSTGSIIPALFGDTRVKLQGYAITPEFRYYLSSTEAPRGFFIGPFLRYRHSDAQANIKRENAEPIQADADFTTIGAGMLVGGQWVFGKHFSMDIFMGPSLNARYTKVTTPEVEESEFPVPNIFGPFGFRAGVTIGFAF